VQNQLAIAQGNIALNLISVYRALGGGWELRLRQQPGVPAGGLHELPPAIPHDPAAPAPESIPTPLPTADPKPAVG
jgi:hypothetical protein